MLPRRALPRSLAANRAPRRAQILSAAAVGEGLPGQGSKMSTAILRRLGRRTGQTQYLLQARDSSRAAAAVAAIAVLWAAAKCVLPLKVLAALVLGHAALHTRNARRPPAPRKAVGGVRGVAVRTTLTPMDVFRSVPIAGELRPPGPPGSAEGTPLPLFPRRSAADAPAAAPAAALPAATPGAAPGAAPAAAPSQGSARARVEQPTRREAAPRPPPPPPFPSPY